MSKLLARAGGVVLACLLLLVLIPASEAFAATCKSNTCTGQDPTAKGCAGDATTLEQFSIYPGEDLYQLRYSPVCNAAWARVTRGDYAQFEGSINRYTFARPNEGLTWISPMISFTQSVRVCGSRVANTPSGMSTRFCTRYR